MKLMDRMQSSRRMVVAAAVLAAMSAVGGCSGGDRDDAPQTGDAKPPAAWTEQEIARHNRAVGLMSRYDYDDARAIFAELHEVHPDDAALQVNLAIATINRQKEGDEAAAMTLLQDVLRRNPDDVRGNYCLGILKMYQGPPADPLPQFELAAAADPADGYAAYLVGRSLEQRDDLQEALRWYEQALQRDGRLISAHLGRARMLRRLGRDDEAADALQRFEQMKSNPRSKVFEFVYGRMGPKAMVRAIDRGERAAPIVRPAGPVFAAPQLLEIDGGDGLRCVSTTDGQPVSVTVCDIDGDGRLDLFVAGVSRPGGGVGNAVLLNAGSAPGELRYALQREHPLAAIDQVNAALWGDWNNDGRVDVYLCRSGPNQLWTSDESGAWENVTTATATSNGALRTVDGALFDADHDGDLDIFCVNADGPNELLNNNRDGTFQPIAEQAGLTGSAVRSRQIVVTDLDADRDVDLVVVNQSPPHDVYLNERAWSYRRDPGASQFADSDITALLSADLDADGRIELYCTDALGGLHRWQRRARGEWEHRSLGDARNGAGHSFLAGLDGNGDGQIDLLHCSAGGSRLLDGGAIDTPLWNDDEPVRAAEVLNALSAGGPALVAVDARGRLMLHPPGKGRDGFIGLTFSGRPSEGETMRSNASGIGARVNVRVDSRWTAFETFRSSSGPGQSRQPYLIGLNGADGVDFIELEWSDGVLQSELDLGGGAIHHITEEQRQLSSCPVVFAWDGETFAFVSDVLGVGGVGYLVEPGIYAPPRPWEKFLMPSGSLAVHDGAYVIKLTEPMEEACYLDAARLVAYDVPPGWNIVVDERMSAAGPEPSGEVIAYRQEFLPARAWNERGDDVTDAVRAADGDAAPVGDVDARFIGLLRGEHVLTMEFETELPSAVVPGEQRLVLMADGWVEYPYSQTMFAAWQAGASYEAPTLEARSADGPWEIVHRQFGYPAGMPRRMSVPLPTQRLPAHTIALRLRTNQEIYWDRLAVAVIEPCDELRRRELPLESATVQRCGFPKRTTFAQRRPAYDWSQRAPYWDTRHQSGWYTAFGDALELVSQPDGALAIIGPGEEVELQFAAGGNLTAVPDGWTRRFVLETDGWCKDMDLYTDRAETLEPAPGADRRSPHAQSMMSGSRSRYRAGSPAR